MQRQAAAGHKRVQPKCLAPSRRVILRRQFDSIREPSRSSHAGEAHSAALARRQCLPSVSACKAKAGIGSIAPLTNLLESAHYVRGECGVRSLSCPFTLGCSLRVVKPISSRRSAAGASRAPLRRRAPPVRDCLRESSTFSGDHSSADRWEVAAVHVQCGQRCRGGDGPCEDFLQGTLGTAAHLV
jgi:hypothetical protein